MSEHDPVDQVVRDITSRPADYDSTPDPTTKTGALKAATEGVQRRHVGASADAFVAEAYRGRFERAAEAPEVPDEIDAYYADTHYRTAADRKVETEDAAFKAQLEAFGRRKDVEHWNSRVEREVLELAYKAIAAGESLTLEEAYKLWNDSRGPGEVSKRMRALFTKRPVTERGNPKGSGALEAERKRRAYIYRKEQPKGDSKKDAFDRAMARVTR